MKKANYFITIALSVLSFYSINAQTVVNSLAELQNAIQSSNQTIVLASGNYNIESLPNNSRFFHCTGSNNTIDLTGTYIEFPVDATSDQHFLITGNDNILRGGTFENTYADGTEEITDYVAYNSDRNNFANGGDPHVVIQGDGNKVVGMKLTVRGSFPYGYGSMYGINNNHQFGLVKRGGIAVQGTNAVIDSCELQMRAFGHAIYIQSPSNHTIIKNTIVIGDLRLGSEVIAETDPNSLPSKSNFMDFSEDHENPVPIDPTRGISLCEDGIRLYNNGGSMHVENCRVEKMRGGIRGYLGSGAIIVNSTATDCESTNFNLPSGGSISRSYGNFAYCPLSDYRLGRSNTEVELTIIPSPHASGSHNLMDLDGNGHDVVFHRTVGPLDTEEERAIVITGDNSTIVNETEYTIILESSANGNKITSCGPVINNGSNNTITLTTGCGETSVCNNRTAKIEAECYDDMFGIEPESINAGGESMAFIENGDWAVYNNIDLSDVYSVQALASSANIGGSIEIRIDALEGELLGTINVSNTGNWQAFLSTSTNIGVVDGIHDVYIVFKGADGYLFNLDWFGFSEEFICNNSTALIEAECFDEMSGIQTQGASEGTLNVGWVNNGDWASYENIDLTNMNSIKTRVSSKVSDGFIEVHLDAADGDLIAEISVTNTGGNQNWVTDSMNIQAASGLHDVYLVFTGGDNFLFNINNFSFSEERIVVTGVENSLLDGLNIYPNPTKDNIHISGVTGSNIELYNHSGTLEISEIVSDSDHQLNLSGLDAGVYFIKVLSNDGFVVEKIIIE